MEWANNLQGYFPLEEPLYEFNPPPPLQKPFADQHMATEWTIEENKLFENALIEFDIASPNFFKDLASRVPSKTVDDIIVHYQALVDDLEMIESGQITLPDYPDSYNQVEEENDDDEMEEANKKHGGVPAAAAQNQGKPKRSGKKPAMPKKFISWTEEEHQLFLMGLNKFGKGDWKSISRHYVITKTPIQVASHAQKFYRRRQMMAIRRNKRRPSIHDIQTVNHIPTIMNYASSSNPHKPSSISAIMAANDLLLNVPEIPNFTAPSAATDRNPMFLTPLINGSAAADPNPVFPYPNINGATDAIDPNPNFLSMPSSSSSAFPYAAADFDNYQNASLAGPPAVYYWFPFNGNN